ncbi:hypothetical protein [Pelagibacterium sp. H642]|uniref:hypothetical protein n=1 Tax=Pelagibacterium sp. H642 TaxID=1881069 RepID=UPI00281681E5|nr:hypothetical protein [Pelagibacterium sp. H642]WMT92811.1 hypothetical protein NO934_18695 [Pelagibacterium sp. H642]
MSVHQPVAAERSVRSTQIDGIDPFVVVAGLILAILLASLLLWLHGGEKIEGMRQPIAKTASSSSAVLDSYYIPPR